MILSVTFSKPSKDIENIMGKPYIRVRIVKDSKSALKASDKGYFAEFFTQKQAFHQNMSLQEVRDFINLHAGKTFKSAVVREENLETTYASNRHGEIRTFSRNISSWNTQNIKSEPNRRKNYIIQEGSYVPFLVKTGVMTKEGKVIDKKYDKFKQINRFLEFIKDIIPEVKTLCVGDENFTRERPLHIADFGCGKSYLTFAVYYYLTEIEHIPVEITGLDLKEDVIKNCQSLAEELGYDNLHFYIGDIADFRYKNSPDIIITLHACDTATDYALSYAISHNASAILSVPCCQHEINAQMNKHRRDDTDSFSSLTRWGIIQDRFAALATDSLRAELLEQNGYSVNVMEFIDMENTPKNLLIRAVRKLSVNEDSIMQSKIRSDNLLRILGVKQTLDNILNNK